MSVNNTYTQRALPNTLIDARFYKSYVHFFYLSAGCYRNLQGCERCAIKCEINPI